MPAASSTRATCTADHLPPRAAGMPRASSPSAMPRNDSKPAACSSLIQAALERACARRASPASCTGPVPASLAKLLPISQSQGVKHDQPIAPICPRCGDPLRLARKFPRLKLLTEMHFYLCGRCGNVETIDNSPKALAVTIELSAVSLSPVLGPM
jgi:hypothetical protein